MMNETNNRIAEEKKIIQRKQREIEIENQRNQNMMVFGQTKGDGKMDIEDISQNQFN